MSAKKTAFSDVKNLLGNTNTPGIPSKSSGLKKPVFGSQFKASNPVKATPSETKVASSGGGVLARRNYKPRFDLSAIDYSDNEPHVACKPSGKRDILYDFWSAASSNFEVYKDTAPEAPLRTFDLPELSFLAPPPATAASHLDSHPLPNLFDDIPHLSFPNISFNDL